MQASAKTIELAIKAIEQHMADVREGRFQITEETGRYISKTQYLQEEYRRLYKLKEMRLALPVA